MMCGNQLKELSCLGAFILVCATACTPMEFTPSSLETHNSLTCANGTLDQVTRLSKILFVVDTSGSNAAPTKNHGKNACDPADPTEVNCLPATDPQKAFRSGSIQKFLDTYGYKQNFHWSFVTFANISAHALVNVDGNDQKPFFSSSSVDFQHALDDFQRIQDGYATPYQAALRLARSAVQDDRDLNSPSQPQYNVIFLTDGFPTDYNSINGELDYEALDSDISSLMQSAPERVHMSTIYYGNGNDPNAIALLKNIAVMGAGQFVSVNDTSEAMKIDDVVPGERECL